MLAQAVFKRTGLPSQPLSESVSKRQPFAPTGWFFLKKHKKIFPVFLTALYGLCII